MIFTYIWPPSILSPNNKAHWAQKAKVKAKYRSDCHYLTKLLPLPEFTHDNIHLNIKFYPPSKRKYDIDNLLARMKSGLDGIADAWQVNDRRFRPITVDFGEIRPNGEVEITINV